MQVMHDRVLIKKIDPVTKSAGGLFLTHVQDEMFKAKVIKVGNGKPIEGGGNMPMTVAEGDVVMYNPNATISVNVQGEALLVIKEEDIFAILDDEQEETK
jgi:chaperonin GroES